MSVHGKILIRGSLDQTSMTLQPHAKEPPAFAAQSVLVKQHPVTAPLCASPLPMSDEGASGGSQLPADRRTCPLLPLVGLRTSLECSMRK